MDDTADGKVLFRLHLSSKEPWKQSAIPGRITLKIWSWGGSLDSLKTDVEVRRHKSLGHANPSKTSLSCWLQAIGPLEGHDSKSKSADKISSDCIQVVSGSDEVLLLGRHHPLIQRFLEDRKELLSCISREHLRLWFDSKSEILFVENLSSNPIVIQNEIGGLDGNSMPPMPGSSSNTVPAGNIARMQNGDLLRFVAPDSLRGKLGSQDLPASFPLSFRVIVEKFDASCAGRKCQGGGGDPLYILKTDTSDHDHHDRHDLICCASCCAELHLANPTYAFRQTTETLPASWNLLCESQAVDVDMYPNATPEIPSGHSWAADFRAQKLHLPSVLAQGVVLKQKQVERHRAQAERTKLAENAQRERLEKEAAERQLMYQSLLTENDQNQQKEELDEINADEGSNTAQTGADIFAPEPRVVEAEEKGQVEVEVPHELQGSQASEAGDAGSVQPKIKKGQDGQNAQDRDLRDGTEVLHKPDQPRKRRILHDAEPLLPQADENHQRLLRLLVQKTGLLFQAEHMEVHAAVQQAPKAAGLVTKVTLEFIPLGGPKFSRLEATLHMDFGALHCECGHSDLADGLPAVLAEQASSFRQSMDFELMDVLGQPPSLDVKATLSEASGEEAPTIQLRLPLLTTSYLRPLQPTFRFAQEWDAPDLQAAANMTSTADWMRPEHATVLTLGGVLQLFHLTKDMIGLAAELPAHGCHESEAVLLRMTAFADGTMTMQARSQELRLARAVAAAMGSLLSGSPAKI